MMKFLALVLVWLGSMTGVHAAGEAAVYYIQTDQLNTPRVITDQSQTVVWKWDSDGFGSMPPNEQPGTGSAFMFNPRFAGQYFDRESNLHYNYYRDYDPQTGRYVQSDPIGLDAGPNTYAYVGGNPLMFIDPYGLSALGDASAIAGAWVGRGVGAIAGEVVFPAGGGFVGGIIGSKAGSYGGRVAGDALNDLLFAEPMQMSKGGKSQGRNWATESAKSEAQSSGQDPCDVLGEWLRQAKAAGNVKRALDIIEAQKFMDCRNKDKRKNKYRCG
nr:RHS repeat-associated core domain-containing protein [Pseudoduganella ginsengisoli]